MISFEIKMFLSEEKGMLLPLCYYYYLIVTVLTTEKVKQK